MEWADGGVISGESTGAEALEGRAGHREKWGGDGPVTRIVCGYFGCERHAGSLFLNGLPAVLKLNVRDNPSGAWIESAIRHAVSEIEAQRPGRMAVLSKLAEALFMETLCRYMDELPPEHTGWLAAGARSQRGGRRWRCCIVSLRAPGRWLIWLRRVGCRARCWRTDSCSSWGDAARLSCAVAASAGRAAIADYRQQGAAGGL